MSGEDHDKMYLPESRIAAFWLSIFIKILIGSIAKCIAFLNAFTIMIGRKVFYEITV